MSLRKFMLTAVAATAAAVGLALAGPGLAAGAPGVARAADGASARGDWTGPGQETTTVRYGPYTLPAAGSGDGDGHAGSETGGFEFDAEKPCTNCYVTGFEPNLVYEDGSNANVNTGPMLHHVVMTKSRADDTTCPLSPSQRIFASGNERVASEFPDGYGFGIDRFERWTMNYELMNHAAEEKTVYVEMTFTHESRYGSSVEEVTPVWMDADGVCSDSSWDAPEGVSERSSTWTSTISGEMVHMRGHLHHAGKRVWTENTTTGETLCTSVATEGGDPEFVKPGGGTEISDMTTCSADSLGRIDRGDELEITARYEIPGHTHGGEMGIMVGWVAED